MQFINKKEKSILIKYQQIKYIFNPFFYEIPKLTSIKLVIIIIIINELPDSIDSFIFYLFIIESLKLYWIELNSFIHLIMFFCLRKINQLKKVIENSVLLLPVWVPLFSSFVCSVCSIQFQRGTQLNSTQQNDAVLNSVGQQPNNTNTKYTFIYIHNIENNYFVIQNAYE